MESWGSVELLGRIRSDRVMRRPAPSREEFLRAHPRGGRPPKHGGEFALADPATWPEPAVSTITDTTHYGKAETRAWDRIHPRLTHRAAWLDHEGALPLIEGTLIRLKVEYLPGDRDAPPVWLWSSKTGATSTDVDRCWQTFLRRFDLEHVRHEALHNRVEVRDLRPRAVAAAWVKQGATRPGERRERVESSPDNAGAGRHCQTARVRQARPEGVKRVNQWVTPRKSRAGSNLVDQGRCAVRDHADLARSTPKPYVFDGGEATLKVCGVGVARLPGYSWAPNRPIGCVVNVGTARGRPSARAASPADGQVRCRLSAVGRGGGPVVVRAGESPAHGQGASKSAVRMLECQEDAGEYRRAGAGLAQGRAPGTGDPDQAAPVGGRRLGSPVR
ncbi:transposase [Nonomuraea thailandensis]|uniref:transposase n=1 Tax=Nonomuraea thailandensis TaxID=1188745 RepID=UPI0023E1D6EC|nr:transposase [Nonomuraea thailandensis]